MDFDKKYSTTANLFGRSPEKMLVKFKKNLDKECSVLDIGAGQGRNTLYLARRGFRVVAIDPSKVAIQTISSIASRKDLPVLVHQAGFEDFTPNTKIFGTILSFGLIQILKRDEINLLIEKIISWSKPGSMVFLTGFTVGDYSFQDCKKSCKKIGKNSFVNEKNRVRTYLEPKEIIDLFKGFEVIHHWEGLGEEHSHGEGPLERHGMVEAIFKKATTE